MTEMMELTRVVGVELVPADHSRPGNSPGWGKLSCVRSGRFRSPDGELVEIKADTTHVAPGYWLARERPELFKPADPRDMRTVREHARALKRARQDLERERGHTTTRTNGTLSLPGQAFRLPRDERPFRLPRARPADGVLP